MSTCIHRDHRGSRTSKQSVVLGAKIVTPATVEVDTSGAT